LTFTKRRAWYIFGPTDKKAESEILWKFGVPYGSRTRVAAVKEKRPIVIQWNFAGWIALHRTLKTRVNAYWTLSGLAFLAKVDLCESKRGLGFAGLVKALFKTSVIDI
jgi:uncharacterized membrane protein